MIKKKHLLLMTICFGLLYYFLLSRFLPISVVENDPSYYYMFYVKVLFVALCAGMFSAVLLFTLINWRYAKPYFLNFKRFVPLLMQLIKRNFITRYKRSALGVIWSLLNPLLTMLVMTLVFSKLFRFDIPNYPVYLISGQIIFNYFSEATGGAMPSVISGGSMIKKVYLPKYIFPVSQVMSSLVNFLFSFIAFLIVMFITGATFHGTFFLFIIPLLYLFIFSLGVGLFLSSVAVFFRDMIHLYGVFMTALSFLTPIFYPISILPKPVLQLIGFNPIYHFVSFFRSVTIDGTFPSLWQNAVCIGFAMLSLLLGTVTFQSQQDKYILHI